MKPLSLFFGAFVCACALGAQTRVDLRTQGKGIDFADAPSTRPAKTGGFLPATCTMGELFFLTTAPAGANLHGCIATNLWALQAPVPELDAVLTVAGKLGNVVLSATDLSDCKVRREAPALLSVASCRGKFPNKGILNLGPAAILATGGEGTAFLYASPYGQILVGRTGTLNVVCTGCIDVGEMTGFPADVQHIWAFSTSGPGLWALDGGIDERGTEPTLLEAGAGTLISEAGGVKTIASDTAVMQTKAASQAAQEMLCTAPASTAATCKLTPMLTSYTDGMRLTFQAGANNAPTMTLDIDGLGVKAILKQEGGALTSGEIKSGNYYTLVYDGIAFRLASPSPAEVVPVVTMANPILVLPSDTLSIAVAANPMVANRIYLIKRCVSTTSTFSKAMIRVTNGTLANWIVGAYTADGLTKLADSGSLLSNAGAQRTISVSATIGPGCYLFAFAIDTSALTMDSTTLNGPLLADFNAPTADGFLAGYSDSWAGAGNALPATVALTNTFTGATNVPVIIWKN